MGRPKGLLELSGTPLLILHVRALARRCRQVGVVLGAHEARYQRLLSGVPTVSNPSWAHTGPIDSLRLALERWRITGSCLVTPVDVLPAQPETLEALLTAGAPAVPCVGDRGGHPVLIGAEVMRQVRECSPEEGLRTLLVDAPRVPVADPSASGDFDDPAAFAAALSRWAAVGEHLRTS